MGPDTEQIPALVIGGGPAGLMAAEVLAGAGLSVILAEAMPTPARKLLMAGKSGLNITRDQPLAQMLDAYGEAAEWLRPIITAFDSQMVQTWARGLGQDLFTGSTRRVFPRAMKASPLLRAWLARLDQLGVQRRMRWRWRGWDGGQAVFDTPDGRRAVTAWVTVLALGGASWARLGSDGGWAAILRAAGVGVAPFAPANAGLAIDWSPHMRPLFGQPLKNVAWSAGDWHSRGEAMISARGLEGGGIYAISKGVRLGQVPVVDLIPDRDPCHVTARLARARGKASLSNHLRKALHLDRTRLALLNEFGRPLPQEPGPLAALLKALPLRGVALRPLDEAISVAGGVTRDSVDSGLMLHARPGVFCAGEMLDWEAPTGGYLLTACQASGARAGQAAARHALSAERAPTSPGGSGC
ncbi:TIGR03862 family flavoprotein, partial [Pontibaca methylaminivorans]|uniref:TIGR03862 family flavoprotein n=1 Tax=Pontibaca methylaminivorans TaxID=515897 RepID=UPI002FD8BD66